MVVCDVLIIGSGPGGSTVADELTNNGLKVIMVETGLSLKNISPYSSEEMDQGYKFAGLRPFIGRGKPILAEAECVGGGSEVNAGIYFRAPSMILDNWAKVTQSPQLSSKALEKYYIEIEEELLISKNKKGLGDMSNLLIKTASENNIKTEELERWIQTNPESKDWSDFRRTSMSKTLLKKAIKNGLDLREKTKALKINFDKKGKVISVIVNDANVGKYAIKSEFTFICAGATSSAALLSRSGYKRQDRCRLEIHQMSRLLGKFSSDINQLSAGIPAVQISQYKPEITIGASYSSIPLMSLVCEHSYLETLEKEHNSHHLIYSLISSATRGKVVDIPLLGETVFYSCTRKDRILMRNAYMNMIRITWLCGAKNIHISDANNGGIKFEDQINALEFVNSRKFNPDISSIHAFASCPIGKNNREGTVDSNGKAFNSDNLFIADTSVLPSSTCLNPQGTVMAVSKMIAKNFIKNKVT